MKICAFLFILLLSLTACSASKPMSEQSKQLDTIAKMATSTENLYTTGRKLNPSNPEHKVLLKRMDTLRQTNANSGVNLLNALSSRGKLSEEEVARSKELRKRFEKMAMTKI